MNLVLGRVSRHLALIGSERAAAIATYSSSLPLRCFNSCTFHATIEETIADRNHITYINIQYIKGYIAIDQPDV